MQSGLTASIHYLYSFSNAVTNWDYISYFRMAGWLMTDGTSRTWKPAVLVCARPRKTTQILGQGSRRPSRDSKKTCGI